MMSPAALPPETRARIAALAERLLDAGQAIVDLLDELDGDADREEDGPCGEEPAE